MKVVFLFRDSGGFASAIYDSLRPNPSSSHVQDPLEESLALSLERYGIKDQKASAKVLRDVDHQVSVLLMEAYEPPVLACAVNEVLSQITGENSSSMPTLIIPLVLPSSKFKWESRSLTTDESRASLYGIQIGPETDVTRAMAASTQRVPLSLQIHHEPSACLLHLVRVLKLQAFVLMGPIRGRHVSDKALSEEHEIIHEMGELLASASGLCFLRDRIRLQPTIKTSKESEEPWRALYG